MNVAIVGAGFSGIAMAIALKREGIDEITVYERADDVGGVWFHNTYPGAACDVPSYMYSYSFEQRRDWSQPCSPQQEILDYLRSTARRYGIAEHVRTRTEIVDASFDERTLRWTLTSADDERFEADVLVLACGQLSRPAWPRIEGAADFTGRAFHSAEWDHEHSLAGRRVAVIGTGASAIQFVPAIAEQAADLLVYQRTPAYMMPRRNRPYPRWMRAVIRHLPGVQSARRYGMWLFMESWIAGLTRVAPIKSALRAFSTSYLRVHVRDRELRRKLTPDYEFGCKRILFSSYWYPALQRDNVELITDQIARVTKRGIVTADGREREVDTIIYGTGFRANDFVAPMNVLGRTGRSLNEAWRDGAEAHLGITVAGFPNMFLLYGPNTNLGVGSIIVMIEAQVRHVVDALRLRGREQRAAIEVRPDVQRASGEAVQRRLSDSVWTACASWYRVGGTGRVTNNWPGQMVEYVRRAQRARPEDYMLLAPVDGTRDAALADSTPDAAPEAAAV
jgi:cation diffusion facilitator CzcD-associated flavoprotein CzcO